MSNTGPNSNLYQIPNVNLGDNFNFWKDVTNTSSYKLNKLKIYEGTTSGTNFITTGTGGVFTVNLNESVSGNHTFLEPIVFSAGVTFNGDVTFNAQTFTLNSNEVTIDDYALILGATSNTSTNDTTINQVGGGGIRVQRGQDPASPGTTYYADWLWTTTGDVEHGVSGTWRANSNIGFNSITGQGAGTQRKHGIVAPDNLDLPIHGRGIRIDGDNSANHGLRIGFTGGGSILGPAGSPGYSQQDNEYFRSIEFSAFDGLGGQTAFMHVVRGDSTTPFSKNPLVVIPKGVNKTIVYQNDHGFNFGMPVYIQNINNVVTYLRAIANSPETSEVVGIVSRIIDANSFELTFIGEIYGDFTNVTSSAPGVASPQLVPCVTYYLSPYVPGLVTSTPPDQTGFVYKAIFIATSPTSALVLPWTGGVMTGTVVLSESASVSTLISQLNKFKVGDVLRWQAGSSTNLTYSWAASGALEAGSTGATYANGIYKRAQANSVTDAEVIGMVTSTSSVTVDGQATGVNNSFGLMMDGYFTTPGITVRNGGTDGALVSGRVYYLSMDSGSTLLAGENNIPSLTDTPPGSSAGTVRKAVLQAIDASHGHVFSYAGIINGSPGISASDVIMSDLLISDLRPSVEGDIKVKVKFGASAGNVLEVMRFKGTTGYQGNIGIGNWSQGYHPSATLDVLGSIRAGSKNLNGGVILESNTDSNANGSTTITNNIFGNMYDSSAIQRNTFLGFNVSPKQGATGYIARVGGPAYKSSLELGLIGGIFNIRGTTSPTNKNVGDGITLSSIFSIKLRDQATGWSGTSTASKTLIFSPSGETGYTANSGSFLLDKDCNALINGIYIGGGMNTVQGEHKSMLSIGWGSTSFLQGATLLAGVNTSFEKSVYIGTEVAVHTVNGSSNVGIGHWALNALEFGAGTNNPNPNSSFNVCIGRDSLRNGVFASQNTTIGCFSGRYMGQQYLSNNTTVLLGNEGVDKNTFIGFEAGRGRNYRQSAIGDGGGENIIAMVQCTAVGAYAGANWGSNSSNTAIGYEAGMLVMDDFDPAYWGAGTFANNVTCLGAGSMVSGSDQVQLGGPDTTPYAYAPLQQRSDARDKIDIRSSQLGLDFLLKLRPVEFRWDTRDLYLDTEIISVPSGEKYKHTDINGIVTYKDRYVPKSTYSFAEKDGSRSGTRFHQGLIAQEVKSVMDEMGIDFSGYQDHSFNGGKDVLTLAYESLIPPLIKAIQELNERIKQLESDNT